TRAARPTRLTCRLISPRPPLVVEVAEKQRANDNDRYELTAHPGKSQGRPPILPGLEAHRPKRPAPLRLPESPCPGRSTLMRWNPNSGLQAGIFMPRFSIVPSSSRLTLAYARRSSRNQA